MPPAKKTTKPAKSTKPAETAEEAKARMPYGAKAVVGTTTVTGAQHVRGTVVDSPERQYLHDYEAMYRNDPYVRRCADYIVDSILASLSDYVHDDPRAVKYVKELDQRMEGSIKEALGEHMSGAIIAGYAVNEKVLFAEDGLVWFKRLPSYHPTSIWVVPNARGEVTEGEKTSVNATISTTGVWQRVPHIVASEAGIKLTQVEHVQLPLNKIVFTKHAARYGNPMGESILAPVWKRLEMVYKFWSDLLVTTERYGSPQVAFIVPKANTNETMITTDGQTIFKPLALKVAEQVAQLSSANGLVLEEPVGLPNDPKIRIQNISSFNNFAEAYHVSIDKLYRDVMVGMGVPPLLFLENAQGLSAGTIAKVHAETFKQLVVSLYMQLVQPFVEQTIGYLLKVNFGIRDPGRFVFKPFDLTAADTMMQTFAVANTNGVLDMSIEQDLIMARRMLGYDEIDPTTMKQRLKNNVDLMEVVRRPAADQVEIAKGNNKTTLAQAETMAEAQNYSVDRAAKTQIEVAKLKPKPPKPAPPPTTPPA